MDEPLEDLYERACSHSWDFACESTTKYLMSEEDLKSSQHESNVPGRTVGFFVMSAIIVFVAIWMSLRRQRQSVNRSD